MDHFSQELIEELRTYWLRSYEQDIFAEEAEQYLCALSELYLCLHEIELDIQKKGLVSATPGRGNTHSYT